MATWSADELATAVLQRLGVVAVGQTAPSEWSNWVSKRWTSIYRYLRRMEVAPWPIGEIDEEAQEPLEKYVAGKLYSKWGITGPREITIKADAREGWEDLKSLAAADKTANPVQVPYY